MGKYKKRCILTVIRELEGDPNLCKKEMSYWMLEQMSPHEVTMNKKSNMEGGM